MTELYCSRRERLPASELTLALFGQILDLFQAEFDHLICQADLPTSFVITEDAVAFRDSLSASAQATNIRVRGWSRRAETGVRLGELLLSDHRAEIRVDGYDDPAGAARFLMSVRALTEPFRRPLGWLYSPSLAVAGLIVGALAAIGGARALGYQSWGTSIGAALVGLVAGIAAALALIAIVQLVNPYAAVRGLGLRSPGRLGLAPRDADAGLAADPKPGQDPASAA